MVRPQTARTTATRCQRRLAQSLYFHKSTASATAISSPSQVADVKRKRLIIGMTGATGAIYGITALQYLRGLGVETHLILSKWARATIKYETSYNCSDVAALATGETWPIANMAAPMSSGSWPHDGMLIAPCSVKTLAAIRAGYAEDLITRSADVCIKERRPLVLMVRETPLSPIHLENMLALAKLGVIIFPAMPAFYTRPEKLEDLIDHSVARVLDAFGIESDGLMPPEGRWEGFRQ